MRRSNLRSASLALGLGLSILLLPKPVPAQEGEPLVVERTRVFALDSKETGAAYRILVAVPPGYEGSGDRRFPVVFTLDAHYSFLIARNVVDHLSEREHLRPAIVVGVGYPGGVHHDSDDYRLNRTRDYTPTVSTEGGYGAKYQKVSGGGPRFLRFLERELIPFVAAHYRATDERVLVGHSFGGLFAAWALLEAPDLFSRVVSVSPSLWYDGRSIFPREAEHAKAGRPLRGRAYFAVGGMEGNAQHDMVVDLRTWGARMSARSGQGFAVRAEVLDGETHNSVFPRALSNGLRFVLEGR